MADRINERREPWPWRETMEILSYAAASIIGLVSIYYSFCTILAVVEFGECLQHLCTSQQGVASLGTIIVYVAYAAGFMALAKGCAALGETISK